MSLTTLVKPTTKQENYRFFSAQRELVVDRAPVAVDRKMNSRLEALIKLNEGEAAVILVRAGQASVVAGALPSGVTLGTGAMKMLNEHFTKSVFEKEYYASLALTAVKTPVLIKAQGNGAASPVVRLVHWFDEASLVDHRRVAVVVEKDSSLQIIEEMVSDGSSVTITDVMAPTVFGLTELYVAAHGRLDYFPVSTQSSAVRSALRVECRLEKGARAEVTPIICGGDFTQLWIEGFCNGPESHLEVRGALRLVGSQWAEVISVLNHTAPHSTSHQEYATAASHKARASFSGNILIPVTGKHVEADLRNRNLLLSREAEINTTPKLEICTDEVRCAHGATVSSVSPEQMYYLQSRGIGVAEAEEMIVRGFTEGMVARLPTEALRARVAEALS